MKWDRVAMVGLTSGYAAWLMQQTMVVGLPWWVALILGVGFGVIAFHLLLVCLGGESS